MAEYRVCGKEYEDWTQSQDFAMRLLNDGIEYVRIEQWNETKKTWGGLQELNLERGIMPDPNFSTHSLAPYYVRLRGL